MPRTHSPLLLAALLWAALLAPNGTAGIPELIEIQEQTSQDTEDLRIKEARRLLQNEENLEAERILRAMVAAEPQNAEALYLLGFSLHVLDRLEDALEVDLLAASIEGHKQGVAFYNAACACALLGRTDEAFKYLQLSHEKGFSNPKLVARDVDLDSLRNDARLDAYLPAPRNASPLFDEDVAVFYHLMGEFKGDAFGWAGRNAGDCNGDGINDLLIAAPFHAAEQSRSPAGRIYVFSGKDGKLIFQRTGKAGWRLGMSVEAAGDVNNDGFNDVIVGADGNSREAGRAFVYSGNTGELLHTFREGSGSDQFGRRVAGAGDINGDGFDDLIVGAPAHCSAENGTGRVYIYSGKDASLLHTIDGEAIGDGFGGSLCGRVVHKQALIAVGASGAGPLGRGRAYVYQINLGGPQLLCKLDADAQGGQMAETYLSFVGDVDRNGEIDLFTSDWKNHAKGANTGRAYVFSAITGKVILTFTGGHRGDTFGAGPGRAGDVDGDGHADLIVGAWRNRDGGIDAGKCTIFSGASGAPLREIIFRIPGSAFGYDATGMGDLDGDGSIDFLITAAQADFRGKNSGSAFVIKGRNWPTIHADQLPAEALAEQSLLPASKAPVPQGAGADKD